VQAADLGDGQAIGGELSIRKNFQSGRCRSHV
jgi:hypothetical protein